MYSIEPLLNAFTLDAVEACAGRLAELIEPVIRGQGYLIHPRTDGKGEPRGEGFELRTDAHISATDKQSDRYRRQSTG